MDEKAIKEKMIELGFRSKKAGGLSDEEMAELEKLRAELQKFKKGGNSGNSNPYGGPF